MQIPAHHAVISHPGASTPSLPARAAARPVSSPLDSSSSDPSSDASTSGASITANDFLELLVTEMKNQDPTANTDPNEYIDQLVQVNSLEQLIQINQDLGGASATSSATGSGASSAAGSGAAFKGNLSPNLSDRSNLPGAANRVAQAMVRQPNASSQFTFSQPASAIPAPLSAQIQSAVKP
jgi:flagellar basal-body rod modification protein FlgD